MALKKLAFVLCSVIVGLLLASCSPAVPLPQPTRSVLPTPAPLQSPLGKPTAVPQVFPTPEAGKASIHGTLMTTKNFAPIPGTQFYLKPVGDVSKTNEPWTLVLVGPEPAKGDVASETGPKGEFFVNNIPPGKYFFLVWAPLNWIPVSSTDDPQDLPVQFDLKAGEVVDLGSVMISWP